MSQTLWPQVAPARKRQPVWSQFCCQDWQAEWMTGLSGPNRLSARAGRRWMSGGEEREHHKERWRDDGVLVVATGHIWLVLLCCHQCCIFQTCSVVQTFVYAVKIASFLSGFHRHILQKAPIFVCFSCPFSVQPPVRANSRLLTSSSTSKTPGTFIFSRIWQQLSFGGCKQCKSAEEWNHRSLKIYPSL